MINLLISLAILSASPVGKCERPKLMLRTETIPRTEAFTFGAEAFDKATADWNKRRYAEAAKGFMFASAYFAAAGVEGNWKYAWQNAALSYEAAHLIEAGKAAFEDAAAKENDPAHAEALRAAASKLSTRGACP